MSGEDLIVPPDVVYVTYIKTTPEKAWEALTSAAFSRKMFFGLSIEGDWKVGGGWAFKSPDGSVHDEGEVLECDPPRKLRLSWRVLFFEEARKLSPAFITYEIEPLGEVVRLTMTQHQPKPIPRKFYQGGKQGWPLILSILKSVLETGEGFAVEMKPPA
ncbi:MAG: SRPBCC family protein [Hyphomonadaceae bacterium]|nr:SRPBCC family protein [Hyphomonadaceae bacterium]